MTEAVIVSEMLANIYQFIPRNIPADSRFLILKTWVSPVSIS
jgi:hypothetical protein